MLQARRGVDSKQEKERRSGLGKTVLFTDRLDGSDENIMRTDFTEDTMEEDLHFRKDLLGVRVMPVFHGNDPTIRVDAFLRGMG